MHKCKFNDPICLKRNRLFGCICGKGGKSEPAKVEQVDPVAQAEANVQAQMNAIPKAAQLNYDVLVNPQYGIMPTTQAYEDVRQSIYPQETAVRNQLVQNVLNQLISPTGYTQEQQSALDATRGKSVSDAQRYQRTRANLGGNLFGGRAQAAEQGDINNLINQFTTEDIGMQERQRLNNSQLALSILQMLYPQSSIQQPNYINPVASADTQYSGAVNQANANLQAQMAKQQSDAAMQSALWQGLGNAMPGVTYKQGEGWGLG